jgi:hypothetical protein
MKLRINYLLGILTISLLLAATVFAHRDHSWGGYHWARTSNPFTVKLGNNVNNVWFPYLVDANADWSSGSAVLDTVIVPGGTRPRRCAITSGQVEVCNERYGNTGWYGVAGITISGGHITGGYVKLNDTYSMSPALKDLVTCQEVGHTFGLAHQDENFNNVNLGTCMDYTNAAAGGVVNGFNYGPSNEEPNAHDFEQLVSIYTHKDSFNSFAMSVPMEIALGDYRSPNAWGRPVRFNAQGQAITFERDFGNGNKIITDIFPVPGIPRYRDEEDHDH